MNHETVLTRPPAGRSAPGLTARSRVLSVDLLLLAANTFTWANVLAAMPGYWSIG